MSQVEKSPLLEVVSLEKKFPVYGSFGKLFGAKQHVHAVIDVSFTLYEGETYGLVGESGSGKSTTGRTILGLTPPTGGQVLYRNQDLAKLSPKEMRKLRKDIQIVFQDPYSSLNPRKRIGDILDEALIIHQMGGSAQRRQEIHRILSVVGLQPEHYFRYPHEFSGGQRQRLGLARALILNPKIIVCDEPVSALDVSIQAQILNMLKQLQSELKLTLLFITHDISVVRHISDRIGIMYLGRIVEEAPTDELFANPLHPYTKALFSAVPSVSKHSLKERVILRGEIPSPLNPPSGCVFHTRCPLATGRCQVELPVLRETANQHKTACHLI
ncbi:ABC transporter ATP-binding protein [Paenibacillus sp. S150]|uniref:ABC transporter ATP-binding protein n=1 Tax=Paenibacillus sp. S150 TaxID=2749826 RepID=UPI001C569186|nr:dipeptide ABC transporter ATP-binding protein [Paenibacillus sp. S150]MBW4083644.1 dipeptide ABC transporter ATP-binding protein [Paenibacillus sp. S150]